MVLVISAEQSPGTAMREVRFSSMDYSHLDFPYSPSISITGCYKMSLFLVWNQLYPACIHGIHWAGMQGIQCPAKSCNVFTIKKLKLIRERNAFFSAVSLGHLRIVGNHPTMFPLYNMDFLT